MAPPWSELTYLGASREGRETVARWTLVPGRWGRHRVGPVRLRLHAGGGAYLARASVEVGELVVYPAAAALARAVAPIELAAPLGEHPSRSVGSGVEFAGVRPYAQGDRQRDVDWRVSARHGDLFVRQYAAERAFDLVLVLDTELDAGEPGRSSLDLTVRAATGLVQTYLRSHDRVGLVTFGGPLRWLTPATGPRQLYRVTEALMSVRPDWSELDAGSVRYGLDHLPARPAAAARLRRPAHPAARRRPAGRRPADARARLRAAGHRRPDRRPDGAAEVEGRGRWPCAPGGCSARRSPSSSAASASPCWTGTARPSSPAGWCTRCGPPVRGGGRDGAPQPSCSGSAVLGTGLAVLAVAALPDPTPAGAGRGAPWRWPPASWRRPSGAPLAGTVALAAHDGHGAARRRAGRVVGHGRPRSCWPPAC